MKPNETAQSQDPDELNELRKLSRMKDNQLTDRQRERLAYLSMRRKADQRCHWGPLWDWLVFILYKFDIEGLCGPHGAPYDEYEPEVEMILPRLEKLHQEEKLTKETVATTLKEVFDQMFSCGSPKEIGHAIERFEDVAGVIVNFFHGWTFQYAFKDVKDFFTPLHHDP